MEEKIILFSHHGISSQQRKCHTWVENNKITADNHVVICNLLSISEALWYVTGTSDWKITFCHVSPSIWFQFLIREKWRNAANFVGCSLQVNLVFSWCTHSVIDEKLLELYILHYEMKQKSFWLAFFAISPPFKWNIIKNKVFRFKYGSILLLQHEYIHWKSNMRQNGKVLWTLTLMN